MTGTRTDEPGHGWRKSVVRDYFESICIAVIFALFVRTFIAQAFKIPSRSMEDNLLVGDHLVVDKFAFAPRPAWLEGILPYQPIRHEDVLVFKFPKDPRRDFIKRVIGVPGDTLAVRGLTVFRDGEPVDEPYAVIKNPLTGQPLAPGARPFVRSVEPRRIGDGQFFMMGDNRLNSEDSRFWGTVPAGYVKGKALFIYWSFDVPPEFVEGERLETSPGERGRLLRYTLIHFFDRTRWNRTFRVID